MQEFNLNQTKKLKINGLEFEVDITDVECIQKLTTFNEKYNGKIDVKANKELIMDCHILIDIVLGNGAYEKLFKKETLQCYLLCFELVNVYQLGITDIYTTSLQKTAEEVKKASESAITELEKINNAIELTKKASEVSDIYAIPKPAKKDTRKN